MFPTPSLRICQKPACIDEVVVREECRLDQHGWSWCGEGFRGSSFLMASQGLVRILGRDLLIFLATKIMSISNPGFSV